MLRDKTIERRVKARMQKKIEEAQAKYEAEKRAISDRHEMSRQEAWEEYTMKLTTLEVERETALEKLEEECVGDACKL